MRQYTSFSMEIKQFDAGILTMSTTHVEHIYLRFRFRISRKSWRDVALLLLVTEQMNKWMDEQMNGRTPLFELSFSKSLSEWYINASYTLVSYFSFWFLLHFVSYFEMCCFCTIVVSVQLCSGSFSYNR